jgi:hypothetical protein
MDRFAEQQSEIGASEKSVKIRRLRPDDDQLQ